jgi:Uma2 family endonuclease
MTTQPARGLATAADIEHDDRLEVVNGEVVCKDEVTQAMPTILHGVVHYAIGAAIADYLGVPSPGRAGGWVFGNEVTIELQRHEVYRPDIAGWRIEHAPDPFAPGPVTVAPDWVLEVLSPSTMAYDLGHKQRIYHQSRVGHYWLAHPHPTHQLLQVYRWHELGYLLVLVASAGDVVHAEPFDAVELDISRILAWPVGTPAPKR